MSRVGRPPGVKSGQSASYFAALYIITHGCTERYAAELYGISPAAVHIAKQRHFPKQGGPMAPFPEDELSC